MNKAGAEENKTGGKEDPEKKLEVDIGHKVLREPEPGVVAQCNGVIHGKADQGHDEAKYSQEHPVLPHPGECVAPEPREDRVYLTN